MRITLHDFKTLLQLLKDKEGALKVRTHTGWSSDFLQIIGFIASPSDQSAKTFAGVVLSNMSETQGILINNISSITAFQLNEDIDKYQASTVYDLIDNLSFEALVAD